MAYIFEVKESKESEPIAQVLICDWRYYLVEECRMMMISETVAYCHGCHDFVPSELLSTPAEEAIAFRKWNYIFKTSEFYRESFGDSFEKVLQSDYEDYRQRIRMIRKRQSPPRCLECGSTNIIQVQDGEPDEDVSRLMHPDYLPKGLVVDCHMHGSTTSYYRLFNTEGEELQLTTDEITEIVRRCES